MNWTTYRLSGREVVGLGAHAGLELRVLRGAVWVTQAGEREDHVVECGSALGLGANGATVVQALGSAGAWVEVRRAGVLRAG